MGSGRAPTISPEVAAAVWEAEDGRCEACRRPMDRRCAAFGRIDDTRPDRSAENLHLLCVDCKARRSDVLARLVLGGEVAARLTEGLAPEQAEQASRWLRASLRRYGVLVWVGRAARSYWLPGVGRFRVALPPEETAAVVAVEWLSTTPSLKVRSQARTRGLPRPDRRPTMPPARASA
jgi:hypothetical protein